MKTVHCSRALFFSGRPACGHEPAPCPLSLQVEHTYVNITTGFEGASASLLVIEETADLDLRTAVGLVERELPGIATLARRLQWSQCQGWASGGRYSTYGPLPCSFRTGVRCMTLPQASVAQQAPPGPACKAQVEERWVYFRPTQITGGLGLSAECPVI